MKEFGMDFNKNPEFNTVTGLTNTTFDPDNVVPNRGATEGQIKILHDDIGELETRIEGCCTHQDDTQLIQQMLDRIDELEAQINDCCNRTCFGESTGTEETCDGATVDVSYSWNGYNPLTDGGQATATSSSGASIASFWFLAYDSNSGIYYKRSDAAAYGAWKWTIDSSGAMRASQYTAGTLLPIALAIVAVDANGCQGTVPIVLPGGTTS